MVRTAMRVTLLHCTHSIKLATTNSTVVCSDQHCCVISITAHTGSSAENAHCSGDCMLIAASISAVHDTLSTLLTSTALLSLLLYTAH
jgi:hypothetical protein